MLHSFLAILFIIKIKLKRSNSIYNNIRSKYGLAKLNAARKWQSFNSKYVKTQLDLKFLRACQFNQIAPKFLQFKLYRETLRTSHLYKDILNRLLLNEIR